MKQYRTLLLALLAVLALTVCALADGEEGDEPVTDTVVEVADQTVEIVSDPDAPQDNDELFYEYMLRLAREQMTPARPTREPTRGVHEQEMGLRSGGADGSRPPANVETAGSKLTGNDKKVYDVAATWLDNILKSGSTITSTVLTIDIAEDLNVLAGPYTKAQLGVAEILELGSDGKYHFTAEAQNNMYAIIDVNYDAVKNALLLDFPYQMFWMDKTNLVDEGIIYQPGLTGTSENASFASTTISWPFAVAKEYSASNNIETAELDRTKINTAVTAAANAATIITENASKSDYAKLLAYKEAICAAVEYNYAALTNTPYGDPWQLIWAFDGNPNTNIVCEGYSKAFKYLCDLSTFNGNIQCYLVTGNMDGGTGAGPHMWNVVTMDDGANYLVDVTNCDTESIGAPDKLFLKGVDNKNVSGSLESSNGTYPTNFQVVISEAPFRSVQYAYDFDTIAVWGKNGKVAGSLLDVSDKDYDPAGGYTDSPAGGGYSYRLDGSKLYLKLNNGAKVIVACYTDGKMTSVQVVTTSTATVTLTGNDWAIFSVDAETYAPLCGAVRK